MRILNFLSLVLLFFIGCKNVVLKNIKTNTVQVAKLDHLFELGDTILYNNQKHEIIRKRLSNGNIVKKEPIIRVKPSQTIPPPSKRP